MLVIRGGQLGSLNDGGDAGFKGCNLTISAFVLGPPSRRFSHGLLLRAAYAFQQAVDWDAYTAIG